MLRYGCLIAGILFFVVFLGLLVTCRLTGLPLSQHHGMDLPAQQVVGDGRWPVAGEPKPPPHGVSD